jgi:hypothetical protein
MRENFGGDETTFSSLWDQDSQDLPEIEDQTTASWPLMCALLLVHKMLL